MTLDMQKHSDEFDALCATRHEDGAEEYGHLKFLDNDMFAFIYEELADAANYLRYQFIKLRLLEAQLDASGIDLSPGSFEAVRVADELSSDVAAFSPSKEVSKFLPTKDKG